MTVSSSVETAVQCQTCGEDYVAPFWVIIDTDERPDLAAQIRDRTLRRTTCPSNGHTMMLSDAPLLLYQPNDEPRILFVSRTGDVNDELSQQVLVHLGAQLRDALGDVWRDSWAEQIKITSPLGLVTQLQPDSQVIRDLLSEMVHLSWSDRRALVSARPELLSDAAEVVLQEAIERGDRQLDRRGESVLTEIRQLLRRTRAVGIDEAFDEVSPARKFANAVPELELPTLRAKLQALAARGVDLSRPEDVMAALDDGGPTLAELQNEALQAILAELPRLTAPEQLERRAELCRTGLGIVGPEPGVLRAQLYFELGWSLMKMPTRPQGRVREAIDAFEGSLAALAGDEGPEVVAILQNLAGAHRQQALLDPHGGHLEKATALLERAWNLATEQGLEEQALGLLVTRASVRRSIAESTGRGVDLAVADYEAALEASPPDSELAATAHFGLGLLRANVAGPDRLAELAIAADECLRAAEIWTRDAAPTQWMSVMVALGRIEAERSQLQPERGPAPSAGYFNAALGVARAAQLLPAVRDVATSLGDLLLSWDQWAEAGAAYVEAVGASERLYVLATTRQHREVELAEAPGLHALAAYALARAGDVDEALLVLERGRARGLAGYLTREAAVMDDLRVSHPDLADRYRQAAERLSRLESRELGADELSTQRAPDAEAFLDYAARASREFDDVVAEIRAVEGHEGFLRSTSLAALGDVLLAHEAAVLLAVTEHGTLALLLRRSQGGGTPPVTATWADLTSGALDQMLRGDGREPGYIAGQQGDDAALWRTLPSVIQGLAPVVAAIADAATEAAVDDLVLVPGGRLSLVPLHAVPAHADGTLLMDSFGVSYAPSVQAFGRARAAAVRHGSRPPSFAGVGNPLPNPVPLTYAVAEVGMIADLFPPDRRTVLNEEEADELSVLFAAAEASHVHLACHGRFDPVRPTESHLALGRGDSLTLAEVMGRDHFRKVRLVVLSACQTGLTEFDRLPDEAIGLPAGFLRAGVAGVVGALWPVDDLSTAVLMTAFYRFHVVGTPDHGPMPPAEALRRAQRVTALVTLAELRTMVGSMMSREVASGRRAGTAGEGHRPTIDGSEPEATRPFSHPYFWAGFTLTGC